MAGPTAELGHALGLVNPDGTPWDPSEPTPELAWPLSVAVFDKMRRTDSKVKGVLNAVSLPIRRAEWRINPQGADPKVVEAIAEDLGLPILGRTDRRQGRRRRRGVDFGETVRLALLSLVYGHYPFELVGEVRDGWWRLTALPERLPTSLAKISTDPAGRLESVTQYHSGAGGAARGADPLGVTIPADRLLYFCHEREGSAWQGQSILRTSYRPWLLKDRLLRVDAIKHERNGLGVPQIEAPANASPAVLEQLNAIAGRFRAGEKSGMALPAGARLRLVGVEGSLPDTLATIRYYDEAIGEETLAQFLDLGQTPNGSRALGEAFIDFFVLTLQAVADELADAVNAQLVERWVDWNVGEDEPAPIVEPGEIGADSSITAEALKALADAGILEADDELEAWVREKYRLPERTTERKPPPDPPAPEPPMPPMPEPPMPPGHDPADPPEGHDPRAGRRRRPFPLTTAARTDGEPEDGPNPDWPGGDLLERITAAYAPRIRAALAASVDPDELAAAWLPRPEARAAAPALTPDLEALLEELRALLDEAYAAGVEPADELLARYGLPIRERPWDVAVDWDAWTPGDARVAAELTGNGGRGLLALLDQAQVTIRGVSDTTVAAIGEVLGRAAEEGLSVDEAAKRLRAYIDDPARARLIAQTETARAMTVAALDRYAEHGITGRQWLLSVGACPLCVENEAAGPVPLTASFPHGDPPVHPRCVCAIAPYIDEDAFPVETLPDQPAGDLDTVPDGVERISDKLDYGGPSSAAARELKPIGDAMDRIHGIDADVGAHLDPTDPLADRARETLRTRLESTKVLNAGRSTTAHGDFTAPPPRIRAFRASTGEAQRPHTFLHELGHRLDYDGGLSFHSRRAVQAAATGGRDAMSPAWRQFFDAVDASPSFRAMVSRYGTHPYWTDAAEIWARAYNQWAAGRLGLDTSRLHNAPLLIPRPGTTGTFDLDYPGGEPNLDYAAQNGQWLPGEFGPIGQAVEAILRERGLML